MFNIKCHYFTINTLFFHIKVCVFSIKSHAAYFYINSMRITSSITHIYFKFASLCFISSRERTCFDQNFYNWALHGGFCTGGRGVHSKQCVIH